MSKVKICGITTLEDAKLAVSFGADAIGLNFFSGSPRCVSVGQAQSIARMLPASVWKVGVFVNHTKDEVTEIARKAALDTLQFHGDEDVAFCAEWDEWRVIKALRVGDIVDEDLLDSFAAVTDFLLFDSSRGSALGGTGLRIPEETLHSLQRNGYLKNSFVAGGLNAENVGEVVKSFSPFGVDAASGVESAPGRKDAGLMERFIRAGK